jgi:hypothetical protein
MFQLLVAAFLVLASLASILASIACIKYLVEHRDKHSPELTPEPCDKNEQIYVNKTSELWHLPGCHTITEKTKSYKMCTFCKHARKKFG